jgi:diguanylate cyclase (GGDEF)-like protein
MYGSLVALTNRAERRPLALRVGVLGLLLATAGVVDAVTGADLVVDFVYALCVIAAAWFVSHQWALRTAGLASVVALTVATRGGSHDWGVRIANATLLGLSLIVFAHLTRAAHRSVAYLVDSSRLDELTGVLSRRGFLDELTRARRRAIERQAPLGVLYLDLDGLKEVNDRQGHAAGDELISRFVTAVQRHLRDTDVFGRLGGDEFAIVLERVDALVIDGVVGRLLADPQLPDVSCGVQVFEARYPPATERLAGADRRMYQDKRRRRGDGRRS